MQIDGVRYFESPKVIDFIANRDPDGVISDSVDERRIALGDRQVLEFWHWGIRTG